MQVNPDTPILLKALGLGTLVARGVPGVLRDAGVNTGVNAGEHRGDHRCEHRGEHRGAGKFICLAAVLHTVHPHRHSSGSFCVGSFVRES